MIRSLAAFLALALLLCAGASAQQAPFDVDGSVALASLVSLADNHLRTMVDTLETIAATPEAASGDWAQIKAPLEEAASVNVPAVLYYGRADGTYWTTDRGKQSATLSDRPYFQRALAGQRTVGDLVTSKSTGKAVAVVVVPVVGKNGAVTGLLGGSIYLDKLSTLLATEMHVGPGMLFWAIDPQGKIALHSDTSNIFAEPGKMSPELQRVMADMLAHDRGTDTYTFRGQKRTVIYEKSPLTGWRYGFGVTR